MFLLDEISYYWKSSNIQVSILFFFEENLYKKRSELEPCKNIIDGDLISYFLSLDHSIQQEILSTLLLENNDYSLPTILSSIYMIHEKLL